ncbi:MAG: hypothetical protein FJ304_15810 [Planctomycetes bacterium]|nr:hypothetical protein [Planctomycetota bacterium]
MPQSDSPRFAPVALLLIAAGVVLHLFPPVALGGDGEVRYAALSTLLRDGKLDATKFSITGPILAAPLWYYGTARGDAREWTWMFNHLVALAGIAALAWALRGRVSRSENRALVLLLLFASMLPWNALTFGGEVFSATAHAVGLALMAVRRAPAVGAVLCVWGTVNTPATAVGLALAVVVLCWHRRRLRYLAMPACAAALILLENYVRRGSAFSNGYVDEFGFRTVLPYSGLPEFSYPLFFGLLSVLFSFGKGLVFFAPGLFAPYPADDERDGAADVRLVYWLWLAMTAGLVLVFARWWAWYGGVSWGPRFFLFASFPAALVLARWCARPAGGATAANVVVLAALVLSCWVGANGLVYRGDGSGRLWGENYEREYLTWYVPELSVLWLPFVDSLPRGFNDKLRLVPFALACAYLAWPVARVLAARTWAALPGAWRAVRGGPRWRF